MGETIKYWVVVASRNHVLRGAELGIFGIGHGKRQPLEQIAPGDKVVFYAPRIEHTKTGKENTFQKFKGCGTVLNEPIFTEEIAGTCVFRRKIQFEEVTTETSIQELIPQLDFILNKKKWGFPFLRGYIAISQRGYIAISQKDWNLIISRLRNEG
jgi:hypothetical protein